MLLAVGAGGAVGGLTRYQVDAAWPGEAAGFPWATLAVNVSGALLLAVVLCVVIEHWPPSRYVRPFAAVGLCGGYTTWSTFMTETTLLAKEGNVGLAVAYLSTSLIAGIVATAAGIALGQRWTAAPEAGR